MASDAELQTIIDQMKTVSDRSWALSHTRHTDGTFSYEVKINGTMIANGLLTDSEVYKVFLNGVLVGMVLNRG